MNYIVAVCGVHRTHRAQRCQPRGLLVQSGIDTRSYAIINVSFASGIDRPLYWQFIHRSPFFPCPCLSGSRARGICRGFILTARDRGQRWDFRHLICVYIYICIYVVIIYNIYMCVCLFVYVLLFIIYIVNDFRTRLTVFASL